MKAQRMALATIVALVLMSVAAGAQWLNHPTPGIPRLPDGKPNLSAPAPRLPDGHPDLSGIWDVGNMLYFHDLARGLKPGEVQLTPWAAGIRKQRMDRNHVDDPYGYCLPLGVPRINVRSPFKILQTPQLTAFLHETFVGMIFRQVFTDGRPLPEISEAEPACTRLAGGTAMRLSWTPWDSAIAVGSAPCKPTRIVTPCMSPSGGDARTSATWN